MFTLTVKKEFSSAHKLVGYQGVCQRIHGHNWKIRIAIAVDKLNEIGIGLDFKIIDGILDKILAQVDHQLLNDIPPFDKKNPTAENLAVYFYESVVNELPKGIKAKSIEVAESDNYAVSYAP